MYYTYEVVFSDSEPAFKTRTFIAFSVSAYLVLEKLTRVEPELFQYDNVQVTRIMEPDK